MQEIIVKPDIFKFSKVESFIKEFNIGQEDLIITNRFIFEPYLNLLTEDTQVIYQEEFGQGEPTDTMVEAIYSAIDKNPKRIIAIGGGTVIDIAKLFALERISPVVDLFDGVIEPKKNKKLVIVPTTCGTGSEVTNISILELTSKGTKKGLAVDALYADFAVLIPEFLVGLPFKFFATSSVDALIHAVESCLSPKATPTTKMFGYESIRMLLNGYKEIELYGEEKRLESLDDFLMASTYAGISFGNAGCAAVHALSYPLGAKYHVPHGESNYALFLGVLKSYMDIKKSGEIQRLNTFIANLLGCDIEHVYDALEALLENIIQRKPLKKYGVTESDLIDFTDSVIENQQRLLANNFTELSRQQILKIYSDLY